MKGRHRGNRSAARRIAAATRHRSHGHILGRGLVIVAVVILPLAVLSLVQFWMIRRQGAAPARAASEYPESMTAHLAADAEEYLAWLADHHWPDDEYLDLENGWRVEYDPFDRGTEGCPVCPGCSLPGRDVWPCPECGMLVHSSCGYGMKRRKIAKPYRTRDMGSESVIAEWRCNRCASVVGLDVDRGDEEKGHGLHQ
jgi:rubredoxin